jgi:hypothetical protein
MIETLDDLNSPPVVGKYYWVKCVKAEGFWLLLEQLP